MKTDVDFHAVMRDNVLSEALELLEPHLKHFRITRPQIARLWYYTHEKRIKALETYQSKLIIDAVKGVI